jgi:hypothetical protein
MPTWSPNDIKVASYAFTKYVGTKRVETMSHSVGIALVGTKKDMDALNKQFLAKFDEKQVTPSCYVSFAPTESNDQNAWSATLHIAKNFATRPEAEAFAENTLKPILRELLGPEQVRTAQ